MDEAKMAPSQCVDKPEEKTYNKYVEGFVNILPLHHAFQIAKLRKHTEYIKFNVIADLSLSKQFSHHIFIYQVFFLFADLFIFQQDNNKTQIYNKIVREKKINKQDMARVCYWSELLIVLKIPAHDKKLLSITFQMPYIQFIMNDMLHRNRLLLQQWTS